MPPEEFWPPAPRLPVEPILRFQRYRDLRQVAPAILAVAEDMVRLAEKLADPRVVYLARPVARVDAGSLAVAGAPAFHGRAFGTHAAAAREAVCFVATIGPALDERVAELAEGGELLEALFLDTAGWLAMEAALRGFRRHLAARARPRGLRLSPRLGPGYLDWPLTEQPRLFSLFGGSPLPVTLSEHCVMTPKKSVSGLFGLLPG
jgi:hypothetical protein